MAGGNYHNQLYNDYVNLTERYEALVVELKKQTAQHRVDWEEMQRLTKAFFIKLDECWLLGDEENKKDDHFYYAKKERALLHRLMKYRLEYFTPD